MSEFTLHLPLPPKELSPNVRAHWTVKARATKAHRVASWACAKQQMPKAWKACAVELDMEYRCSRDAEGYVAADIANALSSTKAAIDGLVDAGIAPNDSKKWLTWGRVSLITRKCEQGDGITVTVRAKT